MVVVKLLTEEAAQDADAKARFLREARVAGNLSHENIINVYDFGEENGLPYMVMEHLRGDDLRSLIKNGLTGDLPWRVRTAIQLARALEYIHAHKIIHRDIKPENIQVTNNGVVKLMDFGIARTEDTQLTRPGFTLGTPFYMAPEQVRGQDLTNRVDIYSFGVLLFELLTGVRAIAADTVERIFYEILYRPVDLTPLQKLEIPQPLYDLIASATAKEPEKRPQSFTDVIAELERSLRRLERGTRPATGPITAAPAAPAAPVAPVAPTAPLADPPHRHAAAVCRPAADRERIRVREIVLGVAGLLMLGIAAYQYFSKPSRPRLEAVLSTSTGDMVLVPAGAFLSGAQQTRVSLPAFYIDKTEVSNADWATFCAAVHKSLPLNFHADQPKAAGGQHRLSRRSGVREVGRASGSRRPGNGKRPRAAPTAASTPGVRRATPTAQMSVTAPGRASRVRCRSIPYPPERAPFVRST